MKFPLTPALHVTHVSSILSAGLDSAFPLFADEGPDGRLDASDAVLVDTIHTCSGFLGLRQPYGHVDFYPNKGTMPQPGCGDNDIVGESVCVNLHLPKYRFSEWRRR
jgi:hypothetical protein